MAIAGLRRDSQPMGDMNTTPLIDVMLVLLIMFIMTIPVATHLTPFDVGSGKATEVAVDPVRNRLQITPDNELFWNATAVSESELATLLHRSAGMSVEPELQFEPAGQASYDLAARVTSLIKRAGVTHFGFVGNERHSEFGKAGG